MKSVTQQALTGLHRLRSTWLATRTARINTVGGLLREFGVTIPVGARQVVPRIADCSPAQTTLSPRCCTQRSPR